mmetsp:Transcript_5505/g.13638  ORF Transcript_5505/g.13638 Transcript_5505/m.13638 type:complete len:698 (+) Transcript_5505:463-2556(+)
MPGWCAAALPQASTHHSSQPCVHLPPNRAPPPPRASLPTLPPWPAHAPRQRARGLDPGRRRHARLQLAPRLRGLSQVVARREEARQRGRHRLGQRGQLGHDPGRAHQVGPEDEATLDGGKAHGHDGGHVQVGRLVHDALRDDAAALVDHGEKDELNDLLVAHLGRLGRVLDEARRRARLLHQRRNLGVGRRAALGVKLVKALAALLAQPLVLVEQRDELADVHALGERVQEVLAHVQAHVRAHQVVQAEGAHGHAKLAGNGLVNLEGVEPHVHQHARRHGVGEEHAVDREAGAVAHHHGRLLDAPRQLQRVQDGLLAGALGAHNLQQRHDVRGREEVRAQDAVLRGRLGAHQVDVNGGRVGGQDAVGAARLLQVRKDALLERDVLDHRLNHHVGRLEVVVREHALHARAHLLRLRCAHRALLHTRRQVGLDARQPAVQELLVDLLEQHVVAGLRQRGGDAAAHEPATQHRHALHGARLEARVRDARHLLGGALRKEDVHQRLVRVQRGGRGKALHLLLQARLAAVRHAVLNGLDAQQRVRQPARALGRLRLGHLKHRGRLAKRLQLVGAVQRQHARLAALRNVQRHAPRGLQQLRLRHHVIHQPQLPGSPVLDGRRRQHHLQRLLQAHQAGQALRAAKPGQDAQLQLGQAHARARGAHARVARHGHLQPAAQGHSMDSCHGWLGAILQHSAEGVIDG